MQTMYNSLNGAQKLDPKFTGISQPNLTLSSFNNMTGTEPSTSTNLFSSLPSTSGLQNTVSQQLAASGLSLQNSLLLDGKLGGALNLSLPQNLDSQKPRVDDWMNNIRVDSLLASTSNLQPASLVSLNTPLAPIPLTLANDAALKYTAAANFFQSQLDASALIQPSTESTVIQPVTDDKAESSLDDEIIHVTDSIPSSSVDIRASPAVSSTPSEHSRKISTPAKIATPAETSKAPTPAIATPGVEASSTPTVETTTPADSATPVASSATPAQAPATSATPTVEATAEKEKDEEDAALEFDETHDDLDNIFPALAIPETNTVYRKQSSADPELSPIAFTPPDSPQNELSLYDIFGIPIEPSTSSALLKPKLEPRFSDSPATPDIFALPSTSKAAPKIPVATKEEEEHYKKLLNKKHVPVYKQKAALMSLAAQENAKREDPNYDAFEFEDDDFEDDDVKQEQEAPKQEEPKPKSVYIPGVGFEIQGLADKPPPKKYQPKPTALVTHADSFLDKVFFTDADKLRAERDQEMSCSILKITQSNSTECAKNTRRITKEQPLLPKFIIRVETMQMVNEEPMQAKRQRKKRKNKNSLDSEDSDFEDVSYRRRKTTKKVYSLHNEKDPNFHRAAVDFPIGPCVSAEDKKRVRCFGPAEGILPKGTYVVCKSDILKDDCAVWRVDNQNLLQKFPPFRCTKTNKIVYKSSSTYSGWCEQIACHYFRVMVRVLKQNRSETTVEPEIPLADLFIASSVEFFKNPRTVLVIDEEDGIKEEEPKEEDAILTDPKRMALDNLLNTYLTQVFFKTHVENLLDKNDFTYSRSLAELNTQRVECERLIMMRIPVELKHRRWIGTYTRVAISKTSFYTLMKCQICKKKKPRRVIHFFDKTPYTVNMTVEEKQEETPLERWRDPVVADAISCGRCSMAVEFLHRMHHLGFHLLRDCRDKLEEIGTTDIDLTSEKMIETAKADRSWTKSIIQKYLSLFQKARFEFRDI